MKTPKREPDYIHEYSKEWGGKFWIKERIGISMKFGTDIKSNAFKWRIHKGTMQHLNDYGEDAWSDFDQDSDTLGKIFDDVRITKALEKAIWGK